MANVVGFFVIRNWLESYEYGGYENGYEYRVDEYGEYDCGKYAEYIQMKPCLVSQALRCGPSDMVASNVRGRRSWAKCHARKLTRRTKLGKWPHEEYNVGRTARMPPT
jgi:hypothetical protein